MVKQSRRFVNSNEYRNVEEELIRNHDFFQGKKILAMKYNDLEWFVTVEDKRKKYGSSLYIVHPYDFVTKKISPLDVEKVIRINWILKRKRDGYRYSWSINGQPMKNTEVVYSEDVSAREIYEGD